MILVWLVVTPVDWWAGGRPGQQLNYVRGLRIRLLGDRVLQNVAWKAAGLLGWPGTFDAEYVALTRLHADALITLDQHLAHAVKDLVTVASIEVLY
jgi:hypothetical protein